MTEPSVPWFIVPLCIAAGVLLVAAGVPLYLRRVPPNAFYGMRIRSTLGDDRIWYAINAQAGRDFIVIGVLYLVLLGAALSTGLSWPLELRLLVPLVVLVVGLIFNTITLARAASRLTAEYRAELHAARD